jgi:hypothetical protein
MDTQMGTLNLLGNSPVLVSGLIAAVSLALVAILVLTLVLAVRRQTLRLKTRIAELENAQDLAQTVSRSLAGQIEQINLELGRVDGAGLRLGLREAIALSRRGADPRELVHTCGIADGEARLIALMHGRRQTGDVAAVEFAPTLS